MVLNLATYLSREYALNASDSSRQLSVIAVNMHTQGTGNLLFKEQYAQEQ